MCLIKVRKVSSMSNPFITPASQRAELAGRRHKQFKIGVYAILIAMTLFLLAMLIQGCKAQQIPSGTSSTVTSMAPPGQS
jgi:hypothetical protein